MHIKHIALLVAVAAGALPGVAAEAGAGSAVGIRAAQPISAYVDPAMAKRLAGAYRLDDGRTLLVSQKSRKLYADMGDGPVQIIHLGNERFEAVGKDLGLRFEGGPFPYAVTASIGAQRQVASAAR